jgi:outer membrane lipoprotein SlyB
MKRIPYLAAAAAVLVTAGCASDPYYDNYGYNSPRSYSSPSYSTVAYSDYGQVVAIDLVRGGGGRTSGGGAIAGAIIGGVLGHQVGSGRGNDVATAAGAIGGAVAGNEIEKRRNDDEQYRIVVRFGDGREATVYQNSLNGVRVGDRVRIGDGRVFRD